MSDYGKKGGTGPTAGRALVRFSFTMPDGSAGVKGTYWPPAGEAVAYVYEHEGKWHVAGVGPPGRYAQGVYREVPASKAAPA